MNDPQEYNAFDEVSDLVKRKVKAKVLKIVLKILIAIGPMLLIFLCAFIVIGGVLSVGDEIVDAIKDFFGYSTEEEAEAVVDDLDIMIEAFESGQISLSNTSLAFMDQATVLRILNAVKAYDDGRMGQASGIQYGNRKEDTETSMSFPEMDVYGELVNEPLTWELLNTKYDTEWRTADTFSRSDVEAAMTLDGKGFFDIKWQEIFVVCAMAARNNIENHEIRNDDKDFSNASLDEINMSEYFLTDEDIDRIINIFLYDFSYWFDPVANYEQRGTTKYSFRSFMNLASGFHLETEFSEWSREEPQYITGADGTMVPVYEYDYDEDGNWSIVTDENGIPKIKYETITTYYRDTYRVPDFAPRNVKNAFTTFTYNYYDEATGLDAICVGRRKVVEPDRLIAACEAVCGEFDLDEFIELLSILPQTEELCEYYRSFEKTEYGYTPIVSETSDPRECSSIGVIYTRGYNDGDGAGSAGGGTATGWEDWDLETTDIVYGDYINEDAGIHRIAVKVDGENFGIWKLHETALRDYTVSEELTVEELMYLFHNNSYFANNTNVLFSTEENKRKTAETLVDIQNENGISVLFFLGIMRIEDALSTNKGAHWNYFNIEASDKYGRPGIAASPRFCDYTQICDSPWSALEKEIKSIYTWYSVNYGQNNAFQFCFMGYSQPDWSLVYHSYCPAWDDCSFPWEVGSGMGSPTGTGWANNVGDFWYSFRTVIMNYRATGSGEVAPANY